MTRTLNGILGAALLSAGLMLVGPMLGQVALAAPPDGRLPPEERERLRQELRQQRLEERQAARQREERVYAPRQGETGPPDRGPNPGGERGGYPDSRSFDRQRMSPEERRQLRTWLRERHRDDRGLPRD